MNIFSSYKVKIKHYNRIFEQTVEIYRNAVSFFIDVCDKEWDVLEPLKSKEKLSCIEKFTLQTKNNQNPKYDFKIGLAEIHYVFSIVNECEYK